MNAPDEADVREEVEGAQQGCCGTPFSLNELQEQAELPCHILIGTTVLSFLLVAFEP